MDDGTLFELGGESGSPRREAPPRIGSRRLRCAVRNQIEIQECSLDELLPEDHQARIVWQFVCERDLSELQARIQAVECGPGQGHFIERDHDIWVTA